MLLANKKKVVLAVAITTLCGGTSLFADSTPLTFTVPAARIVGDSMDDIREIPGSAAIITQKDLNQAQPMSGNDVLRRVSGTYVRDEDGMGLRPNISLRGLSGDRSRKILFLEDGAPVSLAPYGENAAYYTPQIERISKIEIRKGSGSILFGPQTVGGVLNYVTAAPPKEGQMRSDITLGGRSYKSLQYDYGTTIGQNGFRLGLLHKSGDGPRVDMPFNVYDMTAKLRSSLDYNGQLDTKAHYFQEASQVTYAGLTQAMYTDNPDQNPALNDMLYVERAGVSMTHKQVNVAGADLETLFYAYTTRRDWWRQDYSTSSDEGAVRTTGDASKTDGSTYFWKDSNGGRNRQYKVVGIEPRFQYQDFSGGVKLHYEVEDNKRINGESATARSGIIKDDELRSTLAASLFGQQKVALADTFSVVLGTRVEAYQQRRQILRSNSVISNKDAKTGVVLEVIPGVGFTYDITEATNLFAGVHRGFAPPRFSDAIDKNAQDQQLEAEKSWNYEMGVRSSFWEGSFVNGTAFFTDYQNQVVDASESSGVSKANAGQTEIKGVELEVGQVFASLFDTGVDIETSLSGTFVDSLCTTCLRKCTLFLN